MSEIKIKCPTCGKILRLADSLNINQATFTCPVCKDKHVVGKCQRYFDTPTAEETRYSGNVKQTIQSGEETRIASGAVNGGEKTRIYSTSQQPAIGSLVDASGRVYALRQGTNTIGRKAQTSSATVQIVTADHYMSRNHAIIEVRLAGDKFIHILKNGANKNPSYRNGILIADGDQEVLNNGDHMKFGKTELTFKL